MSYVMIYYYALLFQFVLVLLVTFMIFLHLNGFSTVVATFLPSWIFILFLLHEGGYADVECVTLVIF